MAKRNGLWHAAAMELAKRYSPATITLIVHVSERQVRRLLAANSRGGAASEHRAPVAQASAPLLRHSAPSTSCEPVVSEPDGLSRGEAGLRPRAQRALDSPSGSEGDVGKRSTVLPAEAPDPTAVAPRRAEAVALLADGQSLGAVQRQLGCTRAQVDRMRDSAVLAGEIEPPPPDDGGDKAAAAAKRRCDAHLADLVAVYGAPGEFDKGRPPKDRIELPIAAGPARHVAHGGYSGSGSSSPAAACADLG
jgi:hypothetical protein